VKSRWVMTDEDVRDLLDVTERCDSASEDDIFYPDVLAGLRELLPGADVGFLLVDAKEQRLRELWADHNRDDVVRQESDGPWDDEWGQMFWDEFWNEDGCAGPLRTGDYTTVTTHTYTDRAWMNTPVGSMLLDMGKRHHAHVPMTPYGGWDDRRLILWRDEGSGFTERELLMLRLLRPHLAELHARRDRELLGVPRLTSRQWEILRQVATGATNTQVARTLGVSEGTVRKHLENVFVRLDVLSRTKAVARTRPFLDEAATASLR
jgi:DNA-binding CsgD family transcriptional regulator